MEKGIVFFSFDNGTTWESRSKGLPAGIFLSDIAVGEEVLGLSTKQHGIFVFDEASGEWKGVKTNPAPGDEVNVLYFFQGSMLAGTKESGIFISSNLGGSWAPYTQGLKNLTIRKLSAIDNRLYACTNDGLYVFDEATKSWKLEYGQSMLQVNGIKGLHGEIYLGTNKGVFKKKQSGGEWKQIMPNRSLHNISADRKNIYALTYSELFISPDKGMTWQSDQKGLPAGMYSFQVTEKDNTVLAGQWDGVYVKTPSQGWKLSSQGLPYNFPVLELVVSGDVLVVGSSQWSGE